MVFEPGGVCRQAWASYYGERVGTNNRAEATALGEVMEWLAQHADELGGAPIVVYGDSQLVMNFCNRRARPAVHDLYMVMTRVHDTRRKLPSPVFYRHVPRELNGLADWLTNVARRHKRDIDCTEQLAGSTPFALPPSLEDDVGPSTIGAVTRGKRPRVEEPLTSPRGDASQDDDVGGTPRLGGDPATTVQPGGDTTPLLDELG